jgi:hypothetical protein
MPHKSAEERSAYQKAYREANKERMVELNRAYRERKGEEIREKKRAYREANKEAIRAKDRERWRADREVNLAKAKEWRSQNKDWIHEYNKKYIQENAEAIRKHVKAVRTGPKREYILGLRRKANKASYDRHIEEYRARGRARMRRDTNELAPHYVANALGISKALLTPELYEAKRLQLMILRSLKNEKHN